MVSPESVVVVVPMKTSTTGAGTCSVNGVAAPLSQVMADAESLIATVVVLGMLLSATVATITSLAFEVINPDEVTLLVRVLNEDTPAVPSTARPVLGKHVTSSS
jgi:hypothetical protein